MDMPFTRSFDRSGLSPLRRPGAARLSALLAGAALAASLLGPPAAPTLAAGAPSAPQNVHLIAGPEELTVTWTAPASDGGSPLTGYTVNYGTIYGLSSITHSVAPSATSDTAASLSASSGRWMARVCAGNAVGQTCATAPEVVTPTGGENTPGVPYRP